MRELDRAIRADHGPPGLQERIFNYPHDKLISSLSRFFAIKDEFEIDEVNKEIGIISFNFMAKNRPSEKASCAIIKTPQGNHKVRLAIPSLSSATISVYFNQIGEKLKVDYGKED